MWHFLTLYLLPLFPFLGILWSPCCCVNCQFFTDNFAVDDLATNYTSVSGSWSIGSGVLSTSSSNAILTGNTANPSGDALTAITVDLTMATTGDIARIYLDGTTYYIQIKVGTGAYIRIYTGATQLAEVLITRATGTFTVCASVSTLADGSKAIRGRIASDTANAPMSGTNTGWGLGTGTIAGTVQFDNLVVSITSADCAPCNAGSVASTQANCSSYSAGGGGTTLKITPSSIGSGTNNLCDTLGTFHCSSYNGSNYTFTPNFFSSATPATHSTPANCDGNEDSVFDGMTFCSQGASHTPASNCPVFNATLSFYEQSVAGLIDHELNVLLQDGSGFGDRATFRRTLPFSSVQDAVAYCLNVGVTFGLGDRLCYNVIASPMRCDMSSATFNVHG